MTNLISLNSFPLTPLQQGMLYHTFSAPNSGVDIEQILCTIPKQFNPSAFNQAWQTVIDRHPILRTAFQWEGVPQPTQTIFPDVAISQTDISLAGQAEAERQEKIGAFMAADRLQDFDLAQPPLMRVAVFQWDEPAFSCLWSFHHALLDGRSFPIVLTELFTIYDGLNVGIPPSPLPDLPPFSDFIQWRETQDFTVSEPYWRQQLAGITAPTQIDLGKPSPTRHSPPARAVERHLSPQLTQRLTNFAQTIGVTLNTLVQGAWGLLLHHYSGDNEIAFGNTRACRHNTVPQALDMVGLFINTVPVVTQIDPEVTLTDWLQALRQQHIDLRQHEHTPLNLIQSWSDVPAGEPLFESLVVFENYLLNRRMQALGGAWAKREFLYEGQTNFPLTLIGYADDRLLLRLEFDPTRYDLPAMERMLGHMENLLGRMPASADKPALRIPYLSPQERHHLLFERNPDYTATLPPDCLHRRFEAMVEKYPDNIALAFETETLTYDQLNRQANQVAHQLISAGVKPESLVGLSVERSLDIVIGILAILKAGGAYVPIDPDSPPERTTFILEDAGISALLTQSTNNISAPNLTTLNLDETASYSGDDSNPHTAVTPDNLAYVIYTSGSTGKPKGCLISHANAVRLMDATNHWYRFHPDDVWTLFHSFAFDFSVWEIWGALFYGGKIVVVPYWISRSPEDFYQLLIDEGVTVLNQTPSAFRQLIQAEISLDGKPTDLALRYVIFGGEALELPSLRPWFERHGDQKPQLINMYGITETTVHVTYRPIDMSDVEAGQGSIIGQPIPDLQTYVLNQFLEPVALGVPGEIYVGGAGVARGYHNRPQLSAERFCDNPFKAGTRLYKSGDVARPLPNGDLEFIGRADMQVKIRGFRIELGEIEAVIGEHPAVRDNVVLAHATPSGVKHLVSYLIPDDGYDQVGLRTFLAEKLPAYMVPAYFMPLTAFPLTNNGKLNRRALPPPQVDSDELASQYVAPRDETEATLAQIWAEALRVERVGIHDNFFELGGDSILSIQIISRARNAGIQFTPKQLFRYPQISQLVAVAEIKRVETSAEQGLITGSAPITPIQHWFFEQEIPNKNHWNQAFLFRLHQTLNLDGLAKVIEAILTHHDALRLRFAETEDGWMSEYGGMPAFIPLEHANLTDTPPAEQQAAIETICQHAQASLDIGKGELCRFVYIETGDEADRLFIVIHHLVVDGVSWRILLEDLLTAYDGILAGEAVKLPAKTSSFASWGRGLHDYAQSNQLAMEQSYWQTITQTPAPTLPTDHAGDNNESDIQAITVGLAPDATLALLVQAPSAYNSQINDILLTALGRTLQAWLNSDQILIDLEGHGREDILPDVDHSRTVGWFTTVFPVALDLSGVEDAGTALMQVKETLRAIPRKGVGYGIARYLGDGDTLACQPQIVFNYLGQFDQMLSDDRLSLAHENPGAMHDQTGKRRHLLEIVGQVVDGELSLKWEYSSALFEQATIRQLTTDFMDELTALITHCLSIEKRIFTPSDFPLAQLTQAQLNGILAKNADIEDIFALSPMQKLFYSVEAANPALGFEHWHFRLDGVVDVPAFQRVWQMAIDRHPMLRTSFVADGLDTAHHLQHKDTTLPFAFEDLREMPAAAQEAKIADFMQDDRAKGFDLTQPPLTRITLFQLTDDCFDFVWSSHHLQIDGWSYPQLFADVSALYEGKSDLPPVSHYQDYLTWLMERDATTDDVFWREMLAGVSKPTPLPGMENGGGSAGFLELNAKLDGETATKLDELAKSWQVTPNILFQMAWGRLLGAINQTDDLIFGATFSGRPADLVGADKTIAPFVNNLPVRLRTPADQSPLMWAQALQATQLDLTEHQATPLPAIQAVSQVPARYRLFDSLVVYQNYQMDEQSRHFGSAILTPIILPQATNYPLTLVGMPADGKLGIQLIVHQKRFDRATAEAILADFVTILSNLAEGMPADTLTNQQWQAVAPATQTHVNGHTKTTVSGSEMEKLIAGVWQEAFEQENISLYDNFFDLGGHSVMIVAVHAQLQEALGRTFPITKAFQYPTISTLANYLQHGDQPIKVAVSAVQDRAAKARAARQRRRRR